MCDIWSFCRECINGSLVARRPLEITTGYLIFSVGNLAWLLEMFSCICLVDHLILIQVTWFLEPVAGVGYHGWMLDTYTIMIKPVARRPVHRQHQQHWRWRHMMDSSSLYSLFGIYAKWANEWQLFQGSQMYSKLFMVWFMVKIPEFFLHSIIWPLEIICN